MYAPEECGCRGCPVGSSCVCRGPWEEYSGCSARGAEIAEASSSWDTSRVVLYGDILSVSGIGEC